METRSAASSWVYCETRAGRCASRRGIRRRGRSPPAWARQPPDSVGLPRVEPASFVEPFFAVVLTRPRNPQPTVVIGGRAGGMATRRRSRNGRDARRGSSLRPLHRTTGTTNGIVHRCDFQSGSSLAAGTTAQNLSYVDIFSRFATGRWQLPSTNSPPIELPE